MTFHITAVWDEDSGVFYSDSNIVGLHIEAETIEEFLAIAIDLGPEMILANHVTNDDLLTKPLKDLIPVIWGSTVTIGYYSQVTRALRRQGFQRVRQAKGSHEIWESGTSGIKVVVPQKLRSRHTANGILRDAGCDAKL